MFLRRQPRSTELIAEAGELPRRRRRHPTGRSPQPQAVWMSHGKGSKVYDVDGNEYVDMHGGYGAAIAGHAHPAIVEAGAATGSRRGTHFAAADRGRDLDRRVSCPAASTCRCGGSPTPAPKPPWTPCI